MDNRHHDRRNPDDRPDGAPRDPFERDELAGDELLSAYLDGECTAAQQAQLEARVAANPELRQLVEELRGVRASLELLPQHRLEANFAEQVLRRAEREVLTGAAPLRDVAAAPRTTPTTDEPPTIRPLADVSPSRAHQTRSARPFLWAMVALAAAVVILVTNRDPEIRVDPIARGPDVNLRVQRADQPTSAVVETKQPGTAGENKSAESRERLDRGPSDGERSARDWSDREPDDRESGIVRQKNLPSLSEEFERAKAFDSQADDTRRLESDELREKLAGNEGLRPDAAQTSPDQALPRNLRAPTASARARMMPGDADDKDADDKKGDKQPNPNLQPAEPADSFEIPKSRGVADEFKKQARGEIVGESPPPSTTTPTPPDTALGAATATEAGQSAGSPQPSADESRSAGAYAPSAEPLRVVEVLVTRAAWQSGAVEGALLKNRIAVRDADADASLAPASGPAAAESADQSVAKKELAETAKPPAQSTSKANAAGEEVTAGRAARRLAKEKVPMFRGRPDLSRSAAAPAQTPSETSFGAGAVDGTKAKNEKEAFGRADESREDAILGDRLELLFVDATSSQIDATLSALGEQEEQIQVVKVTNATPSRELLGKSLSGYAPRGLADLSGVADADQAQAVQGAIDNLTRGLTLQAGEGASNIQLEISPEQRDRRGQLIDDTRTVPPEKPNEAPAENSPDSFNKKSAADSNEAINQFGFEDRNERSRSTAGGTAPKAPSAAANEPASRPAPTTAPVTRRVRSQSDRNGAVDASAAPPSAREAGRSSVEAQKQQPANDVARKPSQQQELQQTFPGKDSIGQVPVAEGDKKAAEGEKRARLDVRGGRPADDRDRERQNKFAAPTVELQGADQRSTADNRGGFGGGIGGAGNSGFGRTVNAPIPYGDNTAGATAANGIPGKKATDLGPDGGAAGGGGFGGGRFSGGQVPPGSSAAPSGELAPTLPLGIAIRVRLQMSAAVSSKSPEDLAIDARADKASKDSPDASATLSDQANMPQLGQDLGNQLSTKNILRAEAAGVQPEAEPLAGVAAGKRDAKDPAAESVAGLKYVPDQPMPALRQRAVFVFRIVDAPALAARGERAGRAVDAAKVRAGAEIAAEQQRDEQKAADALPVPAPARPSPATLPAPAQPAK